MKRDISNKEDIELIIKSFYEQTRTDETIGFFFSGTIPMNWDEHLKKMCAFWENVLFFTGEYEGTPLTTHQRINQEHPTTPAHFEKWTQLFNKTVDGLFSGENADKMKQHAKAIANVMMQKI